MTSHKFKEIVKLTVDDGKISTTFPKSIRKKELWQMEVVT